jgi:ABC-2 type transport system permease protein
MNPTGFSEQVRRAWAIAKKDIRIYYLKGPVLIFGVFMPLFLFLAFLMGSRQLPLSFLISGLVGMTLFFTATAVSPPPSSRGKDRPKPLNASPRARLQWRPSSLAT